jgi:exopolysaccharide biosynthesis polyprenyl glycosylphosphotransferase
MAAPDFVASNLYVEPVEHLREERRTAPSGFIRGLMVFVEAAADFAVCMAGLLAACVLAKLALIGSAASHSAFHAAPLAASFALVVVFLRYRDGAYKSDSGLMQIRESERAIRVTAQAILLLLLIGLPLGMTAPVPEMVIALFVIPALTILQKKVLFSIAEKLPWSQSARRRVAVYGAPETGRHAISTLLHSPRLALHPVAFVADPHTPTQPSVSEMGYRGRRQIPVYPGPLTPSLLKSLRCDLLLVATVDISQDELADARQAAHQVGAGFAVLREPEFALQPTGGTMNLDGLTFTTYFARPSWFYLAAKRVLDLVVSSALLILMAPILILIAILVRLDTPGPALFVQKRVGQGGELFSIFKFRSMHVDAPMYAPCPSSSSDPRITRVGRILRRTSLDELPQLVNVLMGSMSLVGPRPEMPFIVEGYNSIQRQRLQVAPGITGIWQLSADRAHPIHENPAYDLYYIRNRNLAMDFSILIHTLFFAVRGGI